jgi:hypothetical protein
MKEESLSEKRKDILNIIKDRHYRNYISDGRILTIKKVMEIVEEQDKEFIQRLKERLNEDFWYDDDEWEKHSDKIIDSLAGEELVK